MPARKDDAALVASRGT